MVRRLAFAAVLLCGLLTAVVLTGGDPHTSPPSTTAPDELGTGAAGLSPDQTLANGRAETDAPERSAVVVSPQPAVPSLADVRHRLRVALLVDDQPAAGVMVEAFLADGKGILGDIRLATLSTDVNGKVEFVFQEARALRVLVRGSGDGLLTAARWSELNLSAGETTLRLSLKRGAMLTGRVLDTAGRIASGRILLEVAASEAALASEEAQRDGAALDHEGRFALGVALTGPVVFRVSLDGVGRSLLGAAVVAPESQTDVGDVQLQGAGRIAGRLLLGDGTPLGFAGVQVKAKLVGEPAPGSPGLTSGSTRPTNEGRFEIAGLVPGDYELSVTESLPDLPLMGPRRFPTGTTHAELTVDAWWLFVRARDKQGGLIPMKSADFGPDAASRDARGGSLNSYSVPRPGDVFQTVQSTGSTFYFVATPLDAGGSNPAVEAGVVASSDSASGKPSSSPSLASGKPLQRYTGFLDGGVPSGRHDLDLTLDAHGLGSLRVHFVGDGVVEAAALHLSALTRGSGWLSMERFPLKQGQPDVLWHPLPPGRYALQAHVTGIDKDSDPLLIAEPDLESEFDVLPGATTSVDLPLHRAGNYELQLVGVEGVDQARLKGRKSPEDEWEFLYLSQRFTKGDGTQGMQVGSSFNPAHPVRGPSPMLPGRYSILVECDGYEPVELTLEVLAGEITRREVSMTPAAAK